MERSTRARTSCLILQPIEMSYVLDGAWKNLNDAKEQPEDASKVYWLLTGFDSDDLKRVKH